VTQRQTGELIKTEIRPLQVFAFSCFFPLHFFYVYAKELTEDPLFKQNVLEKALLKYIA